MSVKPKTGWYIGQWSSRIHVSKTRENTSKLNTHKHILKRKMESVTINNSGKVLLPLNISPINVQTSLHPLLLNRVMRERNSCFHNVAINIVEIVFYVNELCSDFGGSKRNDKVRKG